MTRRDCCALLVLMAMLVSPAYAQDEDEEQKVYGTATIKVSPSYPKFRVNDAGEWEFHYYLSNGAKIVIQRLPVDGETRLTFLSDGYQEHTVVIQPKMWKKKLIRKERAYEMVYSTTVKLKKVTPKTPKKAPDKAPKKTAPEKGPATKK